MKILLTGASGFVGSHLARSFVNKGWEPHIVIRPESDLDSLRSLRGKYHKHVHDGSTEGMLALCKEVSPELVVHAASCFRAEHVVKEVEPLVRSNVLFGIQLLEGALASGCRQFINTSTSWQHYQNEQYNPVCLYAALKQAFEDILRYYTEGYDLRVVHLELFDTYGALDQRAKLINLLRKMICEPSPTPLSLSQGEQRINLVHINDVVQAYHRAIELLRTEQILKNEKFSIRAEEDYSLKEIVSSFERISGSRLPVQWGGRPYRRREVMQPWNQGQRLPGWQCEVTLDEGIREILGIESLSQERT